MYEALQPNWFVSASNNSNKHTPFSKHCHNIRVAYIWMYSSGPSNGNTRTFVVGGGCKFCYACITHWSFTYSKVPHNGGGSDVDKATWDRWFHVMSSSGGGTSCASKLPSNSPNVQGNVLENLTNMLTPHEKYCIGS